MNYLAQLLVEMKEELKKFLPDDIVVTYGLIFICFFITVFELVSRVTIINFFPYSIKKIISDVFTIEMVKGLLEFLVFIILSYLVLKIILDILDDKISMNDRESIGLSNLYGSGIQCEKFIMLYVSLFYLFFPNEIFKIGSYVHDMTSVKNDWQAIKNTFFIFIVSIFYAFEYFRIAKALFVVNIKYKLEKEQIESKKENHKKEIVQKALKTSKYLENKGSFEAREKIVKLIKDELILIDNNVFIEDEIKELEIEIMQRHNRCK